MKKAKSYNLITLMGGSLSPKSTNFIKTLQSNKLIDFIETRNVIIKLENNKTIDEDIKSAIDFESDWLEYKAKKYNNIGSSYQKRAEIIKNRI
jgi:predicted kinase